MEKKITCFVPFSGRESIEFTTASLRNSGVVEDIFVLTNGDVTYDYPGVKFLVSPGFSSTASVKMISDTAKSDFILIYTKEFRLDTGKFALKRMMQVCEDTGHGREG